MIMKQQQVKHAALLDELWSDPQQVGFDHANRRLPILLRLQGGWCTAQAQTGRLRVFCSYGTVPCPPIQTGGRAVHRQEAAPLPLWCYLVRRSSR